MSYCIGGLQREEGMLGDHKREGNVPIGKDRRDGKFKNVEKKNCENK